MQKINGRRASPPQATIAQYSSSQEVGTTALGLPETSSGSSWALSWKGRNQGVKTLLKNPSRPHRLCLPWTEEMPLGISSYFMPLYTTPYYISEKKKKWKDISVPLRTAGLDIQHTTPRKKDMLYTLSFNFYSASTIFFYYCKQLPHKAHCIKFFFISCLFMFWRTET